MQVVINHNTPGLPKIYIHRVGRTARAGEQTGQGSLWAPAPPACPHHEESESQAGGTQEGYRPQVKDTRGSTCKLGDLPFQNRRWGCSVFSPPAALTATRAVPWGHGTHWPHPRHSLLPHPRPLYPSGLPIHAQQQIGVRVLVGMTLPCGIWRPSSTPRCDSG